MISKSIRNFVLWNLFIVLLWVWCREGSVVHLRMIVDNEHHRLFCNGKLVDSFDVPRGEGLLSGRPGLGLSKDSRPPLVVKPQELFNFFVTDTDSGAVLLDGAGNPGEWDWVMMRGEFDSTSRNRLQTQSFSMGAVGDQLWRNYVIDVDCANPTELYLIYRMIDKENFGRVQLRFWRELVAGFSYTQNGDQTFHRVKSVAEPVPQAVKSMCLRFIKVYAVAVMILVSFLLLFFLISLMIHAIRNHFSPRTP